MPSSRRPKIGRLCNIYSLFASMWVSGSDADSAEKEGSSNPSGVNELKMKNQLFREWFKPFRPFIENVPHDQFSL